LKNNKIIAILLLFLSGLVWGVETDAFFVVTNDTGFILSSLYISPIDSEDWSDDLLGGNPLLAGESIRVPLVELETPIINIRARDDEGDTYTVYSIDAQSEDITISLTDIDPD
jgi:hypothetical protein